MVRITLKKQQGDGLSVIENLDASYQYNATITNHINVNYRTGGLDITASIWGAPTAASRGRTTL